MISSRITSVASAISGALGILCVVLLAYRRAEAQHLFVVDLTENAANSGSVSSGPSSVGPISPMSAYDDSLTFALIAWGLILAAVAIGSSVYSYRLGARNYYAASGFVAGIFSVAWIGVTFVYGG